LAGGERVYFKHAPYITTKLVSIKSSNTEIRPGIQDINFDRYNKDERNNLAFLSNHDNQNPFCRPEHPVIFANPMIWVWDNYGQCLWVVVLDEMLVGDLEPLVLV